MADFQELMIVKGIAPAIGDTASAEQGLTSINLLVENESPGWSLDPDGWNPLFSNLKGGGLWADSAISPGRTLVAGVDANVIETMNVTLTGITISDLATRLTAMGRMAQSVVDFWCEESPEPVFLQWWALGAPGPQFGLISKIELALTEPDVYQNSLRDGTLIIEREPYWRSLAPGTNPKVWSFQSRNEEYTAANLSLVSGTNEHLIYQQLQNRREWNTTQTAVVSQNYIDIPASKIPGDAPALVEIATSIGGTIAATRVLVGRSTKPTTVKKRDGTTRSRFLTLNAGDGVVGTDTTIAADTGAPQSNSLAAGRRSQTAFVTTTMATRLSWLISAGAESPIDLTTFRGRYAFFLRCRLSASGTVNLQLQILGGIGTTGITLPEMQLTDVGAGGTSNTTQWHFLYMGQGEIPPDNRRVAVGSDGKGVYAPLTNAASNNLNLTIQAERASGTPVFYIADLFMLPIDEPNALYGGGNNSSSLPNMIYDSTGYLGHGLPGDFVQNEDANLGAANDCEFAGQPITLLPGVDNQLLFHAFNHSTGADDIATTIEVRLNIIPRWRGVRSV
jgi:hypothetical protein